MKGAGPSWLVLIGLALPLPAMAQDHPATAPAVKDSVYHQSRVEQQRAAEWGLKREEWQRYRELMQGPLGVYSPNLDPLTALGIEARDPAEQERYAQMQVQAEFARLQKLFDYQNAYDRAYKRLYPGQLPVDLIGSRRPPPMASPAETGSRLAVFAKPRCQACLARVAQLLREGRPFDLYLLDTDGQDQPLRDWARQAGIDPQRVRLREITLNHDAGHWARLGDKGTLPAVMRSVNGQWRRQ
ncbi:TIGR03759 family integrating conjugative element protein [Pseudomonas vanderleydeniana]|uniref:TIGR03759 family integrating conjugative element protein n=1 Tax=Pseudomonas vanderleydeniana TaxID=2745495 RepID=A0A9E6PS66_9PSED|nr:TIGR03759 family integrating conjugative element protein [Pseudomonas vanderleydeniana]QXI31208.1 TIGR03759 family integrating conjugative element protein [Pseudomonas vanderleydeniana]